MKVLHEPKLDTIMMVEKAVLDAEKHPTRMELWRTLPRETVETFQRQVDTSHVPQFLAEEAKYGKEGWEAEFEGKWSVDLYLDLRGIRHGIRSVT